MFNCNENNMKLKEADKGHKALIKELAKSLRSQESLLKPFDTDIEMTDLTLQVLDQIHQAKISES